MSLRTTMNLNTLPAGEQIRDDFLFAILFLQTIGVAMALYSLKSRDGEKPSCTERSLYVDARFITCVIRSIIP